MSTSTSSLLSSFAQDTTPAAKAVAKLLQDPSPDAAKALMADLDKLLPDDPALAAVIAEEMANLSIKYNRSWYENGQNPSWSELS